MIKELFKIDLYPFLVNYKNNCFYEKIKILFKTYGIIFISILFAIPVIRSTDYLITYTFHYISIYHRDSTTLKDTLQHLGYLKGILTMCLFGPLLEEILFRLPLSLKKQDIGIMLFFALLSLSGRLISLKNIDLIFVLRMLSAILILVLSIKLIPNDLPLIAAKYRTYINISSIILFGFVHISNYKPIQWQIIFIYPIYVIPQLSMGWGLTYIRFKNGFIWGVLLHSLINTLSYLLSNL